MAHSRLEGGRLEAISDGVFAIVAWLLLLWWRFLAGNLAIVIRTEGITPAAAGPTATEYGDLSARTD